MIIVASQILFKFEYFTENEVFVVYSNRSLKIPAFQNFTNILVLLFSGDFNSDNDIKGLEADNYEDQLKVPEIDEEIAAQSDFAKYKFIDYIGTDKHGQPIIAIYACKLPDRKKIVQDIFIK